MSCVHLKKLYALCAEEGMKISGPDLIRIVCTQCGEQEVCPTMLVEQYEAIHEAKDEADAGAEAVPADASESVNTSSSPGGR